MTSRPSRWILSLAALLALACVGPPSDAGLAVEAAQSPNDPLPPSIVELDEGMEPHVRSIPERDGGGERFTARLEDDEHVGADFVLGEAVVIGDDPELLEMALHEIQGEVVDTISPQASLDRLPPIHLVTFPVDGVEVELERLAAELDALSPNARGVVRISSREGLATLSAVVRLASYGLQVAPQLIAEGDGFIDRALTEGVDDPVTVRPLAGAFVGGAYSRNPFDWPTLRRGGGGDHGVAEAWRILEVTGRITNTVDVAVIDGGFAAVGHGLPAGTVQISGTGLPVANVPNSMGCGGGSECRWHGTRVSQVLAANADDAVGTVGTGAPVVRLIQVTTHGDLLTIINAYLHASAAGAEIISTSFNITWPALVSWAFLPMEAVTRMLSDTGHLLFAAAGNDGLNVDATDCFLGVCWEERWRAPCENDGVHCIGGTDWESHAGHPSSGYGSQVQMYAPYFAFTGSDPDRGEDDLVYLNGGTSYSAPYVAGVAALVWAAEPSRSAGDVWNELVWTSHPGNVVNAYAAVREALGDSNLPPSARIVLPEEGSSWSYGGLGVRLAADISDVEDPTSALLIQWSTPEEGLIGTSADTRFFFTSPGPRTITLRVTDTGGHTTVDTVSIVLRDEAPRVTIYAPSPGTRVTQGMPFGISGWAYDINEAPGGFPCSSLRWSIVEEPASVTTGCDGSLLTSLLGTVHVTLEVRDSRGVVGRATVPIEVVSATGLVVGISAPTRATPPATIPAGIVQDLRAFAWSTTPGRTIADYTWTVRSPAVPAEFTPFTVGTTTTGTLSWRPADRVPVRCGAGRRAAVRVVARDSADVTATDEVEVLYYFGPC